MKKMTAHLLYIILAGILISGCSVSRSRTELNVGADGRVISTTYVRETQGIGNDPETSMTAAASAAMLKGGGYPGYAGGYGSREDRYGARRSPDRFFGPIKIKVRNAGQFPVSVVHADGSLSGEIMPGSQAVISFSEVPDNGKITYLLHKGKKAKRRQSTTIYGDWKSGAGIVEVH